MVTISIDLAIDRSIDGASKRAKRSATPRATTHSLAHRDGHAMATPGEHPGCPKLELFLPIFCPDHAFLPTNERKNTYLLMDRKKCVSPIKKPFNNNRKQIKGFILFL
jgi:hypothetical protein